MRRSCQAADPITVANGVGRARACDASATAIDSAKPAPSALSSSCSSGATGCRARCRRASQAWMLPGQAASPGPSNRARPMPKNSRGILPCIAFELALVGAASAAPAKRSWSSSSESSTRACCSALIGSVLRPWRRCTRPGGRPRATCCTAACTVGSSSAGSQRRPSACGPSPIGSGTTAPLASRCTVNRRNWASAASSGDRSSRCAGASAASASSSPARSSGAAPPPPTPVQFSLALSSTVTRSRPLGNAACASGGGAARRNAAWRASPAIWASASARKSPPRWNTGPAGNTRHRVWRSRGWR